MKRLHDLRTGPAAPPPHWESVEPVLRGAVDDSVVHLDVVSEEARPQLAQASELTEALRLYDSSYQAELDWWTATFEVSEGIPPSALVSAAETERVDVGRLFPVTGHSERRPQLPRDYSKVLVLTTDEHTRNHALRCGEALSAVLLEATVAGLATCTLTHMTELAASREILTALTGREGMPQALIRVGTAPDFELVQAMTGRRPLHDVLQFHG